MIIAFPHKPGSGGPGSFQSRFELALKNKGHIVCYPNDNIMPDIVLVVGGTKKIFWLLKMKLNGVPIIHRLDGLSWLHKQQSFKNYLYGEWGNFIFKFIHAFFANHVVFQSKFVEKWWENSSWKKKPNTSVIYNGVGLPTLDRMVFDKAFIKRLVILEGTIDYSPYSINLLNYLAKFLPDDIKIELYGKFKSRTNEISINKRIKFYDHIDREKVFGVLNESVYLSLDVNAACPNTVIEALSVGAPVVAYDTGSLKELIGLDSGYIITYGSNPWKLEKPDFEGIKLGVLKAFENYSELSENAFNRFNNYFTLKIMFENYLSIIHSLVENRK